MKPELTPEVLNRGNQEEEEKEEGFKNILDFTMQTFCNDQFELSRLYCIKF